MGTRTEARPDGQVSPPFVKIPRGADSQALPSSLKKTFLAVRFQGRLGALANSSPRAQLFRANPIMDLLSFLSSASNFLAPGTRLSKKFQKAAEWFMCFKWANS